MNQRPIPGRYNSRSEYSELQTTRRENHIDIKMARPIISACLQVLARLLLIRFLYLCYTYSSTLLQAYPHSSLHATLINLGLPEELVNYPCSGIGSVSQFSWAVEIIVMVITSVHGFSRRFVAATIDPLQDKVTTALFFLSRSLRPLWMCMHLVTAAWVIARLFSDLLPEWPHWAVMQSRIVLYIAYLPFVLFMAVWVAWVVVNTAWYDVLWQAVYTIATRSALRGFYQSSALECIVYWMNVMDVKIPSFDITLPSTNTLGWSVLYATFDYELFSPTGTMFGEALELSLSWYSLFRNAPTLLGLVFL
ncbi:hypothetical protein F5B22DRAFT_175515 [Xylaria bambusicola]|uniref:uncharacterized protein n=1 Tax=Xylaria bambusicola TaxID=326684 RepID=UPI0020088BC4|nr:uncharacterized protein F5B22DRAFT_175515 [Xylaria bambusicola]KAI0526724.1 hypothetical protein F5B22DRAFT_175515 [Xylaria bambusicola]